MYNYIIYCDFSTLNCNFKQFAEFLHHYSDDFVNCNNHIWLIAIEDPDNPFCPSLDDLIKDLESAGYADKDSIIFSVRISSIAYRHAGIDESYHINRIY